MSFKFKTPLGEADGQPAIYQPLADAAARGSTSVQAIAADTGIDLRKLVQACAALTSSGQIHPALADSDPAPAQRLNRAVARRALNDEPYRYLAAPAIGNGINASDVEVVAIEALQADAPRDADALARAIWKRFKPSGRRLMKDGKALASEQDNLAELRGRAEKILEQRLPVWRQLGVL